MQTQKIPPVSTGFHVRYAVTNPRPNQRRGGGTYEVLELLRELGDCPQPFSIQPARPFPLRGHCLVVGIRWTGAWLYRYLKG